MNTINFYGIIIKTYIEDGKVVVDCSGEAITDLEWSVPKVIGTDKYIDEHQVSVSSDAIKICFSYDHYNEAVSINVGLNL